MKFEAKCSCGQPITGDGAYRWRHAQAPAKRHTPQPIGTLRQI
jgi:hypothetical protein